ncbi:MAG: SipW-dependent-type signal peptide-containing protein [Clostridia bacterium]|nr:SipW-dependent-type signal peptide-containing protein [Clostridia bacterium]
MNKKRTIIAALVIALILLVGGIMAYFTDTDEKTNVFTIGNNVDITLVEDDSWTKQTTGNYANKYTSNNALGTYPGAEIAKGPYVTSAADTDDTYVFIKVTSPVVDGQEVLQYTLNSAAWIKVGPDDTSVSGKVTRVFAYATEVSGTNTLTVLAAEGQTPTVFGNVTINSYFEDATKSDLIAGKPYDLDVKAYGIQATGLSATDLSGVWGNFNS